MRSNTSYQIQVSGAEELIRHGLRGLHGFIWLQIQCKSVKSVPEYILICERKLIPPLRKGRLGGVDFPSLIINHPQPLLSKEGC